MKVCFVCKTFPHTVHRFSGKIQTYSRLLSNCSSSILAIVRFKAVSSATTSSTLGAETSIYRVLVGADETAICENTLGTPFRAFCECDLAFVKEISRFEKENAIGKNSGYRLKDCVKPEPPTEPVEPPVTGCCESETGLLSHFNKGSVI